MSRLDVPDTCAAALAGHRTRDRADRYFQYLDSTTACHKQSLLSSRQQTSCPSTT